MQDFAISAELEAGGDIIYRVLSLCAAPPPRQLFQTAAEAAQWIQQFLTVPDTDRRSDVAPPPGTSVADATP